MKRCSKCGETKVLEDFHRMDTSPDGRNAWCKTCKKEYRRVYYDVNAEQERECARAWAKANRERMLANKRKWHEKNPYYDRRWRKANPDKRREQEGRMYAKYPEKFEARIATNSAVSRGDLPPARTIVCEYCQEAQAAHWHHHNGYNVDNHLDVVAACANCHAKEHRAES